eukprot:TRINITY_DN2138_c0_g1_i7.p1 TRINITY_DN2138_c0_g1~~TRINITY_DN2138_c0_g1_i7.p1  ORF type:complete len:490 (+),score=136.86 TRINITY_DN2138_c0_g1_i7:105-1574(+)
MASASANAVVLSGSATSNCEHARSLLRRCQQRKQATSSNRIVPRASAGVATLPTDNVKELMKALEWKSLSELRALGREKGVRGDTKKELIRLLAATHGILSIPSAPTSAPAAAAAAAVAVAPAPTAPKGAVSDEQWMKELMRKSIAELRQIAKSKGLRGDTKTELVKLLLSTSATPAPPTPAAASTPPPVSAAAPITPPSSPPLSQEETKKLLQSLSVGQLRYLTQERGLRGDTKAELVKLLLDGPPLSMYVVSAIPAAPRPLPVTTVAEPPRAAPAVVQPPAKEGPSSYEKLLLTKPLAELRAIAKQKGLRGDTKAELVQLLVKDVSLPVVTPSAVLPPFQSTVAAPTPPSVSVASSVAVPVVEEEEEEEEDEELSFDEQTTFLMTVLVGGVGLALVPLIIPFTVAPSSTIMTDNASMQLGQETSALLESMIENQSSALEDIQTLLPLVRPAPEIKVADADEFCNSVPRELWTAPIERFCSVLSEIEL